MSLFRKDRSHLTALRDYIKCRQEVNQHIACSGIDRTVDKKRKNTRDRLEERRIRKECEND